jgi:hypothetical protein
VSIPTVEQLTFRRVAEEGYGRGLATTVTRFKWQAVKPDGEVLTGGQRTRAECVEAATDVLAMARVIAAERGLA